MKFVLVPDSFKGTLSFSQVCAVTDEKVRERFPDSRTASVPMADGGEGSVDAFITAVGDVKEYVTVKNPYSEDMESYFGLVDGRQTAVIEMASCVGLLLVEDRKDPRLITTYGVGQLILAAADKGVKEIIMGLGSSSTNDGDCSAAIAAGIRFYDGDGREFISTGGTTADIDRVNLSGRDSLLEQVGVVTMCDTDNPMYGPTGVSFIFGPQEGTDEAIVLQLDEGTRNLSRAIAQATGVDASRVPGTGATRAMGVDMIAFFGSGLRMGIRTVLDTVKFGKIIDDADYILTGKGKLGSQNLWDEVVIGTAKRTNKQTKAVIAVVGGADDDGVEKAYDMGVTAVLPINRLLQDFSVSRHRSQENLAYTVDSIIRLIKTGRGEH